MRFSFSLDSLTTTKSSTRAMLCKLATNPTEIFHISPFLE